jgi:hypothetical protein
VLPDDHSPKASEHHRVSKNVVEQFGGGKIAGVKDSRPHPCIDTNDCKHMPEHEEWRVVSDASAELKQTADMDENVEQGKENGRWFLHTEKSHKRPLAVKLRNLPLSSEKGLAGPMHALVLAFVSTIPADHILKCLNVKLPQPHEINEMIYEFLLHSLSIELHI